MEAKEIEALLRQRQNKFVEDRTKIETQVDAFFASLQGLDPDIKVKCGVVDNAHARDVLPALWQEPFDEAAYNDQLSKFNAYVAQVRSICDQLNQEALACLQS